MRRGGNTEGIRPVLIIIEAIISLNVWRILFSVKSTLPDVTLVHLSRNNHCCRSQQDIWLHSNKDFKYPPTQRRDLLLTNISLCVWQIALILRELNILRHSGYFHKQMCINISSWCLANCWAGRQLCVWWRSARRAPPFVRAFQIRRLRDPLVFRRSTATQHARPFGKRRKRRDRRGLLRFSSE